MKRASEKSIMQEIAIRLKLLGWNTLRVPPSIYGSKGWCDLIALKDGYVLFIECKSLKGKQTEAQKEFQSIIEAGKGLYILAKSWQDVKDKLKEITTGCNPDKNRKEELL